MRVVILGAGVTGLAVAWKLCADHEVVLVEKRPTIGGIAMSFKHKDFVLDSGPHKIYSLIPGILDEMKALLGPEATTIPKTSGMILMGKRLDYPVKFTDLLLKLKPSVSIRLGFSYGITTLLSFVRKKKPVSYDDYFRYNFGDAATELVFSPLAEKAWGHPKQLSEELARRRVPYGGVLKMLKTMLFKDKRLSAANFYYPRHGFIEMSNRMLAVVEKTGGKLIAGAEATAIKLGENGTSSIVFKQDGQKKELKADYLVSTVPINILPKLLNAPPEIVSAAYELKYRSLILVYILVNKPRVMKDCWTFVPDPSFIFTRISEQKNFSKDLGPENQTVLITEVMCTAFDPLWNMDEADLYKRVIADLVRAGFVTEAEGFYILKLRNIYPVYEIGYKEKLNKVLAYTDQFEQFMTLGRQGLFNYNNTDHCMDMAIQAANHIRAKKSSKEWTETRKRFDDYVIVD
jgi:protoporphyrinogen oxidase